MFVLKVSHSKLFAEYVPNSKHEQGGIDYTQIYAFKHLFPKGNVSFLEEEMLFEMVKIHGWEIEVKEVE